MTIDDEHTSSTDSADSMPDLPFTGGVTNTAGEEEREALSRRFNAVEGLAAMALILVILWPIGYFFGVMQGLDIANVVASLMLVIGGGYALLMAPLIHKDAAESWGLGNPRTLWRLLTTGRAMYRVALTLVVAALFLGLNYANYLHWEEVVDFFGLERSVLMDFTRAWPGRALAFVLGVPGSILVITMAIRYDNFWPAFRTALIISLPLLVVILAAAWIQRGPDAFTRLQPIPWAADVLAYVFWGFVQQLLFCSYFGTRFRKAFAPSLRPGNTVPPGNRPIKALLIGANLALAAYILSLLGLSIAYGPRSVPFEVPLYIGLACLPFGALYGYYLCVDRKRLLVATLTGICFGLIHIDSYFLVAVTFGIGIPLSYVFMEDRKRNLVALGFVHGLLGSTFGKLFSKGESGLLEVDYGVGPWNIEHPAYDALIIPMFCIAVFLVLIAWASRHLKEPIN